MYPELAANGKPGSRLDQQPANGPIGLDRGALIESGLDNPPPADTLREAGPDTGEDDGLEAVRSLVRSTWGFADLRPEQERAVRACLAGRDALVVLPTGGGKSLCYQAPALVRPGLTVVVSPLISLMKDQLDGLLANGVAAGMLTSAQESSERSDVYRALDERRLKLLLVAPERLVMDGFLPRLEEQGLSSIAVDEAHCISHWGHHFRPEYRQLGDLRMRRPDLPIQAYTATATPRVREDIVAQLGLVDPDLIVGDCDRPNLTYRISQRGDLLGQIVSLAGRHPGGAGIVYCIRRKDVEKLARDLAGRGLRCLPYHAGLPPRERRRVQDAFQGESIDIVVATVAFGMGIDRPDVRFVAHASLPKGVEQYSQETGRAGRDGLPSECVLFFSGSDFHSWKGLIERGAQESELAGDDVADEVQNSIDRLGHMWNLAGGAACRHASLVEYFGGEWKGENCGACDVCLGELETVADSQVVAQKILSCVVRCEQRFGGGHVADVLRGAKTARIRQLGHEALSTYGLLSGHTTRELRAWIDQLVAAHHLGVAPGDYPTLYLTQSGLAVMKGEQDISLFLPRKPAKKKRQLAPAEEGGPPPDEGLFEHLRKLRRRLAAERGVPPYILFNDRTLASMSAHKPRDDQGFRALKGVGDKKAVDLGPTFLEAIAVYLADQVEATPPA